MALLSFVIPCYRSEKTIRLVIEEIIRTVSERPDYDYEIICVNDCSPDNVYSVLIEIAKENNKIKIINLVKNMGKHAAVMAGYSFVKGDYIVNLDDDFQSPVDKLWDLIEPLEEKNYDIVTANYFIKKEALWKRMGSRFNRLMSEILLDKPKGLHFENFFVMKRFVVDEIVKYKNPYPYLEGLILRVTNKILTVKMDERTRADDNKTGFTFWKSLSLFANGFTNFSVKPLRFALIVGMLFASCGFLYGLNIIARKFFYPEVPIGYSSMMSVLLFSSGMIMLLLGIIGEYVGRIFICINSAPQYVIRNTINLEGSSQA